MAKPDVSKLIQIDGLTNSIRVEFHQSVSLLLSGLAKELEASAVLFFVDPAIKISLSELPESFSHYVEVTNPESWKNWRSAETLLQQIVLPKLNQGRVTFVVLGGGALSDLVGFIASLVRRGSPLILIPSTWLAAVDSVHGGKNAINFDHTKNLLGSYHFPERVLICEQLLLSQPEALAKDAWSEFLKMAIIDSSSLYERSIRVFHEYSSQGSLGFGLWQLLPEMIEAKYQVVRRDPFERKGIRQVLNLGHTLGHTLEGALGLSHGYSVALGLRFAEIFSKKKGFLTMDLELPGIPSLQELGDVLKRAPNLEQWLGRDKKSLQSGLVDFVFIHKPGHVEPRRTLLKEILLEIERLKVQA